MMRNARAVTAVLGSLLLVTTLMIGSAVAQSAATDTTSQPAQSSSQESQSSQPAQPSAPPQAAPDTGRQSDSRTDVRSETRIVETERSKFLGLDPGFAVIVGAVLFIVVVLAIVAMTRKTSTAATSVETRRSSM
jgi:preprotein translocase subunit SecG